MGEEDFARNHELLLEQTEKCSETIEELKTESTKQQVSMAKQAGLYAGASGCGGFIFFIIQNTLNSVNILDRVYYSQQQVLSRLDF